MLEGRGGATDGPDEMSPYAPRITTIQVPIDKIGEVIGPKGKMINSITEETGASISIEDDGTVYVGASNGEAAAAPRTMANHTAHPHMPRVGERSDGTVVKPHSLGPAGLIVVPANTWHRFETPGLVKIITVTPQPGEHQDDRPEPTP